MGELQDKVAVITGATGNLGAAVAERFATAGARLVLIDRGQGRLEERFPALAGDDRHLLMGGVEGTDELGVTKAVQEANERLGSIDALANTVGGFAGGTPVVDESLATWDRLLTMNLRTTVIACKAVIRTMQAKGRGRIVNTAAGAGLAASGGYAAYAASKAGVIRLTEALAQEHTSQGITVNCVLPGIIDTPSNRAAMPHADVSAWVAPEAIADVFLFLCSDASRAITGASIPVTGRG